MPGVPDPAKVKKPPADWAEEEGMVIVEPFGWMGAGEPSFETPCIYAEYHVRALKSVLGPLAGEAIELQIQTKENE